MLIWKEFRFEAAHWLTTVPEGHKCGRLHGHSFVVRIGVEGPVDPVKRWVMDFSEISAAWYPLHDILDHRCLNEVVDCETTSEDLAVWIWNRLKPTLPMLSVVEFRETCTSGCEYRGPA